jgi:response regulator RpfG family c-di-GMP phosphodiesterase
LPELVAMMRLRQAAGAQFDPAAVEALLAWRESEEETRDDGASDPASGSRA